MQETRPLGVGWREYQQLDRAHVRVGGAHTQRNVSM
jgi:hypothetical protein